jgi:hypothetical protein
MYNVTCFEIDIHYYILPPNHYGTQSEIAEVNRHIAWLKLTYIGPTLPALMRLKNARPLGVVSVYRLCLNSCPPLPVIFYAALLLRNLGGASHKIGVIPPAFQAGTGVWTLPPQVYA